MKVNTSMKVNTCSTAHKTQKKLISIDDVESRHVFGSHTQSSSFLINSINLNLQGTQNIKLNSIYPVNFLNLHHESLKNAAEKNQKLLQTKIFQNFSNSNLTSQSFFSSIAETSSCIIVRTSRHDAWYFIWMRIKFDKLSLTSLIFWDSKCSEIVRISFKIFEICMFDKIVSFSFFWRRFASNCFRFAISRSRSTNWALTSSLAFWQIIWYWSKSWRIFSSILWTSMDRWSARKVRPFEKLSSAFSVVAL